jgi:hypothetical protein
MMPYWNHSPTNQLGRRQRPTGAPQRHISNVPKRTSRARASELPLIAEACKAAMLKQHSCAARPAMRARARSKQELAASHSQWRERTERPSKNRSLVLGGLSPDELWRHSRTILLVDLYTGSYILIFFILQCMVQELLIYSSNLK